MKTRLKRALAGVLMAGFISTPVFGNGLSEASANSSAGLSMVTGSVIVGTISTVANGSQLVVEAIEKVGEGTVYVLKNVSTGVTLSVKTMSTVVGMASVAVGTAVTVVADASGHVLMASGKAIAFIPNEVGKSLIHSRRSVEREVKL